MAAESEQNCGSCAFFKPDKAIYPGLEHGNCHILFGDRQTLEEEGEIKIRHVSTYSTDECSAFDENDNPLFIPKGSNTGKLHTKLEGTLED